MMLRAVTQQVNSIAGKMVTATPSILKVSHFLLSFSRKSSQKKTDQLERVYLVTNDLSIDADRIYKVYQKRWRIEEFHKSVKQNASLSKSPMKTIRTQGNHLFAAMIAFSKLELLKVKTVLNYFAIKHKLLLKLIN